MPKTPSKSQSVSHAITSGDNELHVRLAEYANDARGAFSPNTIRAIKSDVRHFTAWCEKFNVPALPTTPEVLARYVDEMASTYAASTIRRRISSIAHIHRAAQLTDPIGSDKVRLALRRMQRSNLTRPKQAQGINENNIAAILATTGTRLVDKRDIALLLTTRDILARRSEVVALNVEDITFNEDGTATVIICKSKTDQEGQGSVMWLSARTVISIREWLSSSNIESGALFRSLRKGDRVTQRLSDNSVARLFKSMAKRAGINPQNISGHSARVGMAQDLSTAGAELTELMTAGRWKSPQMPARYTERTRAACGAVAKYYDRSGSGYPEIRDYPHAVRNMERTAHTL